MPIDPTAMVDRAERMALGRTGTMRGLARLPLDVVIENLSESGALLRTAGTLPVGTLISLGIAGAGVQMARITRTVPGGLAAEFLIPLEPQALAEAATVRTLVSIAFPQPGDTPAPRGGGSATAAPGEAAGGGQVVRLPGTPMPSPDMPALTYGAAGLLPAAPRPVTETSQPIDPRALRLPVADAPAPRPRTTTMPLNMIIAALLIVAALLYLLA